MLVLGNSGPKPLICKARGLVIARMRVYVWRGARPSALIHRKPLASFTVTSDPVFYLAVFVAVTSLGLSKGGFAGVGQIATPLLAIFMPPLEAAAILLPIMMLQDAISVWVYRREFDPQNLKIMLPGAIVGICVAWALAAHLSEPMVRIAVGVISIAFILYGWFAKPNLAAEIPPPNTLHGMFWGSLSGFTSTLCQAGGPPFQIHVLPQRLPKMVFVGTTAIFFAIVNALKVIPYFALGQFSTKGLWISAALVPLAIAANFLGFWVVRRVPTVLFYKIAYVLVFLISLELVRGGIVALWHG